MSVVGFRVHISQGQEYSSSLLLSSLDLSDTNVYEPQIRAQLGTAAHFWDRNRPELDQDRTSFLIGGAGIDQVVSMDIHASTR